MATIKKEKKLFLTQTPVQLKDANEARWLKSKRSSTEQSIMDAGRQPFDKKKSE